MESSVAVGLVVLGCDRVLLDREDVEQQLKLTLEQAVWINNHEARQASVDQEVHEGCHDNLLRGDHLGEGG